MGRNDSVLLGRVCFGVDEELYSAPCKTSMSPEQKGNWNFSGLAHPTDRFP